MPSYTPEGFPSTPIVTGKVAAVPEELLVATMPTEVTVPVMVGPDATPTAADGDVEALLPEAAPAMPPRPPNPPANPPRPPAAAALPVATATVAGMPLASDARSDEDTCASTVQDEVSTTTTWALDDEAPAVPAPPAPAVPAPAPPEPDPPEPDPPEPAPPELPLPFPALTLSPTVSWTAATVPESGEVSVASATCC